MNRRRGFRLRPIVDEDGEPTTRAELESAERLGDTGWQATRRAGRVEVDPETVARLVELQRGRDGAA